MTNSLEVNCQSAIVNLLATDPVLAAVPPRKWNDSNDAEMPRIAVKARQGRELACGYGLYEMTCEVAMVARVLSDVTDDWMRRARALITDRSAFTTAGLPNGAEYLLTTASFVCKAVVPLTTSSGNDGDKRTQTLAFEAIGHDLDRFATYYVITGPSSGPSGMSSGVFTVTLFNDTFNAAKQVSLHVDSGSLTIFTGGSSSSSGGGNYHIIPESGAQAFTFVYTPSVKGVSAITPTNSQGWNDPSPVSYTSL